MTILRNTILHADCLKALPMLPDKTVNFILTDPPYITRYKSRDGRIVPNDETTHGSSRHLPRCSAYLRRTAFA